LPPRPTYLSTDKLRASSQNSTEHALDRPRAGELAACDKFWADARARLGRLYRLTDRDLDEIESLLAKRIPKPVPESRRFAS
jgi:hypothetical protein